jgi:hypothetical protein
LTVTRAIRTLLVVAISALGAIAVPRETGVEDAFRLVWRASITAQRSSDGIDSFGPSVRPIVGDTRWALIDIESGIVHAAGLRAERFAASLEGVINQSAVSPRWVVQSWSGEAIRFVENAGIPRFYGDLLVQFGDDAITVGDAALPYDATLVAFDLAAIGESGTYVATGDLRGVVTLFRFDRSTSFVVVGSSVVARDSIGPVYGIRVVELPGSDGQPAVVTVRGGAPHSVEYLIPSENRSLVRALGQTAPGAVERPVRIAADDPGVLAFSIPPFVTVWDIEADLMASIPVPRLDRIVGYGVSEEALLAGARTEEGAVILLVRRDGTATRSRTFLGVTPYLVHRSLVVLGTKETIIALERGV